MNKIEIPLSKTKISLVIIGSLVFVALGALIIAVIADQQTRFEPALLKGIGVVGILFFGATGIYGIRKMFDTQMGLILDEEGIHDNSSAASIGVIKWTDITSIKTEEISSSKFLLIYVSNPEDYIDRVKGFRKKMIEANHNMHGTPLSIPSTGLKCKYDDMVGFVREGLNNYGNTTINPD